MRFVRVIACVFLCLYGLPLLAQKEHTPEKNPLVGDPEAIVAGKKLYEEACQICHGGDARGGRGPALAAGDFLNGSEDGQIYQNIHEGIAGTQMPAFEMLPNEIWQLVSYIRSLSGAVAREEVPGDAAAGESIFFGKGGCTACHQINGRGSRLGPDLSSIGRWRSQTLRETILNPNQREGRERNVVVAKTRDGREIRGLRRNEDSFSLQMMDAAGQFHLFEKKSLAEVRYEEKSLMPDDYGRRLSASEMDNLVAYLKTLRVRDLQKTAAAPITGGLDYERIRNSSGEPHNWPTYWGDYQGRHYARLKQITTENVGRLQVRWAFQVPGGGPLEATPIVVDGVMYTTGVLGRVFALDARTGRVIWQYQRRRKTVNPYDGAKVNRGVAILGGRIFFTTSD